MTIVCFFLVVSLFASPAAQFSTNSFYIRHFSGKCLTFNVAESMLQYQTVCRDKFRWQNGARIIHEPTNLCIRPTAGVAGSKISLSTECTEIGSVFTYNDTSRVIKNLVTGFCLHGMAGKQTTIENEAMVYSQQCDLQKNRHYFQKSATFIIRQHTSGYCWVYDKVKDQLSLQNTYVCDRFEFVNSKNLRHMASGKCVQARTDTTFLSLSSDCSSIQSVYERDSSNILHHPASGKCVHPHGGSNVPTTGTPLLHWTCITEDRFKWNYFDDKDILRVTVHSEDCTDAGTLDCSLSKGHIFVNGYQYSPNNRGINLVLFDYRSGILERVEGFDIFEKITRRDDLARVLNHLSHHKLLLLAVRDAVKMNINLALALTKVGISQHFTEGIVSTDVVSERRSLAAVLYSGHVRTFWEHSTYSKGGGPSTIHTTLYPFRNHKGYPGCAEELGLRTGRIPDEQMSAQSIFNNDKSKFGPQFARLHNQRNWCAKASSPVSDVLQVDLGQVQFVSGVAVQASGGNIAILHPIRRFYISFSKDGDTWMDYTKDGVNKHIFWGNLNIRNHVNVNWFGRAQARFVRIIPVERHTDLDTHCVKIELFGCHADNVIFSGGLSALNGLRPGQFFTGEFSFQAYAASSSRATVFLSTSEQSSSLAKYIDQYHFQDINLTATDRISSNLKADMMNVTYIAENTLRMKGAVKVEYNLPPVKDHYKFNVLLQCWMVDSKVGTGNVWNTYSYETNEGTFVVALPFAIRRRARDYSILALNISKAAKANLISGDSLVFNVTLSPWMKEDRIGHSNAYNIDFFVYFHNKFLKLRSAAALLGDDRSLFLSSNASSPGFFHIAIKEFGPINIQIYQFTFDFTIPSAIMQGRKCKVEMFLELKYQTNLLKYGGTLAENLEKLFEFKCHIPPKPGARISGNRLPVPTLSIVYNEVENDVVFCKPGLSEAPYHFPSCYWQGSNNVTWSAIAGMSAVVGIDTAKRYIYGINNAGNAFVRSGFNFKRVELIQDDYWTSVQDHRDTRKAKSTDNLAAIPRNPTDTWILPSRDHQVIAVTEGGLRRKSGSVWNKIVTF